METDVLIIGGGATGGGIAWDLALRGVRVILAEMGDLATGTSGRYHGLLHSGGRYAVRDPESARECIDENRIVRRVAPEAIEPTGGYFVLCPGDDETYVDQWLAGCAAVGIETRAVPLAEALRREPALNPRAEAVYEVPDATCDSWDLLHAMQKGAESTGRARFLTYHRVEAFHRADARIVGATLRNLRDDTTFDLTCACVVNAAGPWAAQIGALAGASFGMRLSRGAMLAYNVRWVNTVINKLRAPGDGDIFVPVGTVSVIGTTSVPTDDPADTRVESWEVTRILDEAEAMTPGISKARILRAWGGVRPLFDPGGTGREAKRTFTVLDHADADGIAGFVSVLGGKLTTYRLMAEKVADLICIKLNVTAPCATAATVLPPVHEREQKLHHLRDRLAALEHGDTPGDLICECEIVTRPQIEAALASGGIVELNDLRRDLRLGMGPCQGGFCAYRAAGITHEFPQAHLEKPLTTPSLRQTPEPTVTSPPLYVMERGSGGEVASAEVALLTAFVERRFSGVKPLLWGHNLRQALLAEHIYARILGLSANDAHQTNVASSPLLHVMERGMGGEVGEVKRIVILGAGLAGLTAALIAADSGARVELIAAGQGALPLSSGWIELGDPVALAQNPDHPYAKSGDNLALALSHLARVTPLIATPAAITATGRSRSLAFTTTDPFPTAADPVLIVGFTRWRDFYARWIAGTLADRGFTARAADIDMPDLGGSFDNWSVDLANFLDTDAGRDHLIRQVKPLLGGATYVGFPAVLGFKPQTRQRIADSLGVPIFEIPTLPPSVPGLRLYHALRRAILDLGGRITIGATALALERDGSRVTGVLTATAAHGRSRLIPADAVILATGGLFGGGLESDYRGIVRETVADLPVANVPPLPDWFAHPLLGGQPQPIHHAGILTDADLRPLDSSGEPAAPNLYVAGRLLAGYSPIIEGSTEGVDLASAARAAIHALRDVAD